MFKTCIVENYPDALCCHCLPSSVGQRCGHVTLYDDKHCTICRHHAHLLQHTWLIILSHVCYKHKLILSRQTCVHGPGLVLHTLESTAAGAWKARLHEQVQGAGRSCYHSPSPQPCRCHTRLHTPHGAQKGPHLFVKEDTSGSVTGHKWVYISFWPKINV